MRRVRAALFWGAAVLLPSSYATASSLVETRDDPHDRLPVVTSSSDVARMPEVPTRRIAFETTEGTFIAVDVSPDGETVVFDLLGDLYVVSTRGGDAIALTQGAAWDQSPRFSTDGAHIFFLSDRKGYKNVWRLSLADKSLHQVTRSNVDIPGGPNWLSSDTNLRRDVSSGLNWSQDGSRLLASVVVTTGAYTGVYFDRLIHAIDPLDGAMTPVAGPSSPRVIAGSRVRNAITIFSAAESDDGKMYYSKGVVKTDGSGRISTRLFVFDAATRTHTEITPADATYSDFKPHLSNDGQLLAYFRQYDDRRTELRILNRTTGEEAALANLEGANDAVYSMFDDSRPNFAFTPDDQAVVFWHDGKIRRADIANGKIDIIPFRALVELDVAERVRPAVQRLDDREEATTIRWPSLTRDGKTLVFSAVGYIWIMDVYSGDVRRLSYSDDFEYMPAISPNGSSVAYISFAQSGDAYSLGRLMVADLDSGEHRELLASPDADYLLPRWSPDSAKIAVVREGNFRKGTKPVFGWTYANANDGAFHEVASDPNSGSFAGSYVYARSVGFNASSTELLFSYPTSRITTVLMAADVDTGVSRTLAIGTSEVGGIVPSPDLRNLVLTRRDGSVWIVPFESDDAPVTVSTLSQSSRRVSQNAGYYVDWNDARQFTFGFAKDVYTYSLHDSSGDDDLRPVRIDIPVQKPATTQLTAFTGARLVSLSGDVGTGTVIESGTLLVDGRRIAAVGPTDEIAIPSDALVVDVAGKTIIPGLLDTHYHAIGGTALALPRTHGFEDRSAIMFGVTSAWNPGGPAKDDGISAIADLHKAGRILAPRWSYSKAPVGGPYELLSDYAAALAAVEQQRDLGTTVLKEYTAPTREQRQWLSAAARDRGLGIVSHLESFDSIVTRIVDGYTGGDHASIPVPFFKDLAELLRQSGYIWTPNLMLTFGTTGTAGDVGRFYCNAVLQSKSPSVVAIAESECEGEGQDPTVDYGTHPNSQVAEYVAHAASNGASIGVSAHHRPGSNLHREMWLLWKGGMSIEDVLRAATMTNAEKLGLQDEVGSLEVGKMADFLVLNDNPLDDILNTLSLKYTVQGGVVYDSATGERTSMRNVALLVQEEKALH